MTILASRRLALGLTLALALTAGSAAAQSAADKETARVLFEKGKAERDRGDFASALKSFKEADKIMQVPTTKLAVARAHAGLGQLVEAREAALAVASIPAGKKESLPFVDARASAKEMAADLDTRVPLLNVKIVGAPAGEEPSVTIDGAKVAPSELTARRINPGKHVIAGTVGTREAKTEIELAERDTKDATLDFTPVKEAPAVAAPKDYEKPHDGEGSRSSLIWIGLGVAVVGVGVGATTGLLSMGEKSTADESCRDGKCPPQAHDALDSSKTFATDSTIGFVAAGVGVALAAVGFAMGKSPKQTGTLHVRVVANGAGLGGTF